MITIGIDPVIGNIGSLAISWHGVLMALGILTGILFSWWMAKRTDIPRGFIFEAAIWCVVLAILGARLVHVLDRWSDYSSNPVQIFAFWEGGLAWYGGLLGGILAGVIWAKLKGISWGLLADVVAPGVILGLAVGRIGCTINGDICGTPTSSPWSIIYTHPASYPVGWGLGNTPLHPVTLYEIILNLIIFGVLLWLWGRLKPEGSLFAIMMMIYSFGRFFISWLRPEQVEASILGPLHQAHIISLVLFFGAIAFLVYRKVGWAKGHSPK